MTYRKNTHWFLFVSIAIFLVIVFGTVYATTQQSQRRAANDPQIQLAEDAASSLNTGTIPAQFAMGHVDMNHSLATFMIIYDKTGKVVAGNGYLDGQIPTIPTGVLQTAVGKDYHFVTWQPKNDVSFAAVAVAANNYYVVSGRSLKEVEKNIERTFWISFVGGVVSVVLVGGVFIVARHGRSAPKKP